MIRFKIAAMLTIVTLTACGASPVTAPGPTVADVPSCGAPCYPAQLRALAIELGITPLS